MNEKYNVYLVSDSTGETLDRIFLSLKSQFANFEYDKKTQHLKIFSSDVKQNFGNTFDSNKIEEFSKLDDKDCSKNIIPS